MYYNYFMIKFSYLNILIVLILFVLGWYFFGFGKSEYKKVIVQINENKFNVLVADDVAKRSKGLAVLDSLKENEGMLFVFDYADKYGFWMKDMKFAIDIIWIKDNKIVDITSNVEPEPNKSVFGLKTYYPKEAVDKVLEVAAGVVEKYNIKINDEIIIEELK